MQLQFTIPSMACSACAATITQAIHAIDAQATVEADLQTKQVAIATTAPEASVRSALEKAGYPTT